MRGIIYGLHLDDDDTIRYVGKTKNTAEERLRGHLKVALLGNDRPISRWIRKNGPDRIRVVVLETCGGSSLDAREKHWVAELRTETRLKHGGLNCTGGGEGGAMTDPAVLRRLSKHSRAMHEANPEHLGSLRRGVKFTEKELQNFAERRHAELANHARWHVKRGVTSEYCSFCTDTPKKRPVYVRGTGNAGHNRWHVGRGIVKPDCLHCRSPQPKKDTRTGRSSSYGGHRRWHVARGIVKHDCEFCTTS